MKKIFALAVALGTMTVVFAQRGYDNRQESRDVILGQPDRGVYTNDHGYNNGYAVRDRDEEIRRINNEYKWRIESVKHDHYLRKAERKRQIRFLENERDARIREVVQRYNYRNYGDRRDRDYGRDHSRY